MMNGSAVQQTADYNLLEVRKGNNFLLVPYRKLYFMSWITAKKNSSNNKKNAKQQQQQQQRQQR